MWRGEQREARVCGYPCLSKVAVKLKSKTRPTFLAKIVRVTRLHVQEVTQPAAAGDSVAV